MIPAGQIVHYQTQARRRPGGLRLAVHKRLVDVLCRVDIRRSTPLVGDIARTLAPVGARKIRRRLHALFDGHRGAAAIDVSAAARELYARNYMTKMLTAYTRRHGWGGMHQMLDHSSLEALEPFRHVTEPTMLITWHVGPPFGLATVFAHLAIPSLAVIRRDYAWPRGQVLNERIFTMGGSDARTDVLWTALHRLRSNGLLLIAVDGIEGTRAKPAPCLGRGVQFARGPFTLVRMTGAKLVPIVPKWKDDGRVGIVIGTPIATDREPGTSDEDYEATLAARAARWYEGYLETSPEELRPSTLRILLDYCPRLTAERR